MVYLNPEAMDQARLLYLFQRYVDDTCSDAEKQELMQTLAQPASDEAIQALMDKLWEELPEHGKLSAEKTERILERILPASDHRFAQPLQKQRALFSTWMKVAAAVTLALLAGAAWYGRTSLKDESPLIAQASQPSATEHQFLKLPDGSTVVLNAGSHLEYPASFEGMGHREVLLRGEGYFDIKHDVSKPFIVRTGKLTTTVLGTAFNIKAYDEQDSIVVTVTRGKVQVNDDDRTLGVITPNQQITFRKLGRQSYQRNVNSNAAIAWKASDIFFDDITLEEAAAQLEERFHVTIRFENEKTRHCRFTATFLHGEDLDQILQIICEFNGANYLRDAAGNMLIKGDGC
ncbi:FecR family protein [Chryseolinea soli]|uniref:FecR family protein n=2 Tax=Chryseolinea soli TaxID=2321403 RepID=A0A385SVW4_9BACT|nr:FecR family protein [Chryseolinea soli]